MLRDSIQRPATRRDFLQLISGSAAALMLGDLGIAHAADLLAPSDTASYQLTAHPMRVNLGGRTVSTIGFNGSLPGPLIRLTEGDRLHVDLTNNLNAGTTIHWHGLPIVNKMDGVPHLTQPPIAPGTAFAYDFKVPVSGTYWYHSHAGAQNDRGMYGPLVVDAKHETLAYDREVVLVLDDWRDGMGGKAYQLRSMYECERGFERQTYQVGRPPAEPQSYPLHLVNGRAPNSPTQVTVKAGEVIRLRLINAGAATVYRVTLDGHTMRVTHADGQPVVPVDVQALDVGMAERYDVLIHARHPGVWQFAARPSSPGHIARAVFRYEGSSAKAPPATYMPRSLKGKRLQTGMLQQAGGYGVPHGKPDMTVDITLNARFGAFYLTFNGRLMDADTPFPIPRNSHVRFKVNNNSAQIHPMHLHGHFFQVNNGTGNGPMKDTIIISPSQTFTLDWIADNPGLWMYHCHNLYHMLNGLMHTVKVS